MLNKIEFLVDLFRIFLSEAINFIKSPKDNKSINKLFPLDNKKTDKRLVIISLTNNSFAINVESLFAKYFNNQGYEVYFLTDFRNRRALKTFKYIGGKIIYQRCSYFKNFFAVWFKKIKLPTNTEDLKEYIYDGYNIGKCVYASVSRKFKVGQLDFSNKEITKQVNRFLRRSIVYVKCAEDIINKIKPDLLIANEKGYMSTYEIYDVSVAKGIDFIQWVGCPEPDAYVFKRYHKNNTSYHPHSISPSTWQKAKEKDWTEKNTDEVKQLFEEGYMQRKWFRYNRLADKTQQIDRDWLVKKYSLDPNKKIAILFAHVMWDANLFYGEDLFKKGFEEWYVASIKAMAKNKNVNWIIKIHPANRFKHEYENIKVNYREITAVEEFFGSLPTNIKFIYPEDEINPYSLFKFIDYGITVRGTIGAELPCFGVPVLTAGTGRYSGLGFTNDSATQEEYLDKILHIEDIPKLEENKIKLAQLHFYLFLKVRPLVFTSFSEKWQGKEQDVEIKINDYKNGADLVSFADWAANSKDDDHCLFNW